MQKLLSIFLFCLLLIASHDCISQNILGKTVMDFSTKAPAAQQMQKFIDIPVSHFNGKPNIAIPFHTASSKSISVPLTLRYDAGGIKAEEDDSYIGLGWSLGGVGVITRTVRGNEDEGIRYQYKRIPYKVEGSSQTLYRWDTERDSLAVEGGQYGGWYVDAGLPWGFPYDELFSEFTNHNQTLKTGNQSTAVSVGYPYFSAGLVDNEPDLFYFDFGGYSGKFIFDYSNEIIQIPHSQDLKITTSFKSRSDIELFNDGTDTFFYNQHYFESFTVSTPDGKDYYFGETPQARGESPYNGKPSMYNSWYLTRIVDRNTLDTVYFDYFNSGFTAIRKLESKQKFVNPTGTLYDGCVNTPVTQTAQYTSTCSLKSIKTSKEEVQFFGIDSVKIIDNFSGTAYRTLQLDFGRLQSGRRALIGFFVKDLRSNSIQPYSFKYYDIGGYKGPSSQDYWGYYNDATNNNRLMIAYPGCTTGYANRAPAWPAMQLDALTEIIYPTGGKTIFEYEPHSAWTGRKLDNSIMEGDGYFVGQGINFNLWDNLIGGLRIKTISSFDPIKNDTLIKRFYYNIFGTPTSSGHIAIPPSLAIDCSDFACSDNFSGNRPTYLMSTHNQYIGSGTGSHVTYRNVTVQEEKNGLNNGRTEYEYYDDTNTDSAFYSNAFSPTTNFALKQSYEVYPNWQFRRLPENFLAGSEKEKRIYNSAGQLLQKQTSFYGSRIMPGVHSVIVNAIQRRDICNIPPPPFMGAGGQTGIRGILIDSATGGIIVEFSPANSGSGKRPVLPPYQSYYFFYRTYTGNIFIYPSKTISESYATPAGFSSDTTIYYYENNAHNNPTQIVTRNSKGNTLQQQNLYAWDFNEVNNGDSTIHFMKKAFLNLPLAGFSYNNSNITSGAYRHYKLKSRQDSTIALPFEEYSLTGSQTGITAATLNLEGGYPKTLNFPLSNFQKQATFYYNPDNTVSHILKKGNDKIAAIWDYDRQFAVAQVANADSADIAFAGFETTTNGNWTISSSLRDTSTALTGKRAFSLTNGNIIKTNLNTAKSYIVSYWSTTSAATVNGVTATAGVTRNGWTYFEHKLPVGIGSITITGNVIIDELRLYPSDAQMTTYAFEPLLGVSSINSPNNVIVYYEYDGTGKLLIQRDADRNIVKLYDYFYTGFGTDTAAWRSAGGNTRTKPCDANPVYSTDTIQVEQIDINPNSPTYGTRRWAFLSRCFTCVLPDWQFTATPQQCVVDANNVNTGQVKQEQRDMNPCSDTYNQTRWTITGTNTTACPIPPPPCTGPDKMMINGVCVTGIKVYIATGYNQNMQKWECSYRYEFLPDCIKGPTYTEYRDTPCVPGNPCIPQ